MEEKMNASTASLPPETPRPGISTELIIQVESGEGSKLFSYDGLDQSVHRGHRTS
jgi:hypothetical protein